MRMQRSRISERRTGYSDAKAIARDDRTLPLLPDDRGVGPGMLSRDERIGRDADLARNGQSRAMIITMTRARVAATMAVIAICIAKFSKPKR
jgi:hypothetical protein